MHSRYFSGILYSKILCIIFHVVKGQHRIRVLRPTDRIFATFHNKKITAWTAIMKWYPHRSIPVYFIVFFIVSCTCFIVFNFLESRAVLRIRDVPRQFCLGGRGRGDFRKGWPSIFLTNYFYIANLFNSTWYKDNAKETIYYETHIIKLMNYWLKFGQASQCSLKSMLYEQLSWSLIDIGGVTHPCPPIGTSLLRMCCLFCFDC